MPAMTSEATTPLDSAPSSDAGLAPNAGSSAEDVAAADAQEFARAVVAPNADVWERERRFANESFEAAAERGLTGLLAPTSLGGRGLGPLALARVVEAVAAADLAAAFSLVVHNNHVRAVTGSGNEALIAREAPSLIAGERVGAFLLTEPGVGSDATAITTTAERDGDMWVINGEKAWVTNAAVADSLNVFAQTQPGQGHRGIVSILVTADLPGVTRLEPYELLGGYGMGTGGFRFEDVRVPVADTLVEPGAAFAAAMGGIDVARIVVGAGCCGLMQTSLDIAVAATASRELFGSTVARQQGVQWMLADAATDLAATRLLTYDAARLLDQGADATVAAAHAKKFGARAAERVVRDCMQSMGATGLRRGVENPLPRHLAAARVANYLDGTTEIQNVVIARSLWRSAGQ